jgi:hypothetical protein
MARPNALIASAPLASIIACASFCEGICIYLDESCSPGIPWPPVPVFPTATLPSYAAIPSTDLNGDSLNTLSVVDIGNSNAGVIFCFPPRLPPAPHLTIDYWIGDLGKSKPPKGIE